MKLNVNLSYLQNDEYEYTTMLKRTNLDLKRRESLASNNGFVIQNPQTNIKKQLKDDKGIYSTKYGQTLQDINPFADRYKCKCGYLTSRINYGLKCPLCNSEVKYIDDNFKYFGWVVLKDPYYIIHPNLYKAISSFIGKDFNNILAIIDNKDIHGHSVQEKRSRTEPFKGIGMMEFKERFVEVMDFYKAKHANKQNKMDLYYDIMQNKDNVFTQSVPVYTALLRGFKTDGIKIIYEKTNGLYTMIVKLAKEINNDKLRIYRKKKSKDQLLYDMNKKYQQLYDEIINILSGKKGIFRTLFGGRFNFTSRDVIVADPSLRIDEISLPYQALVQMNQQRIINTLQKTYNYSPSEAKDKWEAGTVNVDPVILKILEGFINDHPRGIPHLINRNPTIAYGSILMVYCVKINLSFTMGMPLQILKLLAADFDGDVLNVLTIINKEFEELAANILNPRNAFYISRNDGRLNKDVLYNKDTIINMNGLCYISDMYYTEQDRLDELRFKEKYK